MTYDFQFAVEKAINTGTETSVTVDGETYKTGCVDKEESFSDDLHRRR